MSEDHFQSLFEYAPISLWEEDFSGIKNFFDDLRKRGVKDLAAHLAGHSEDIDACMKLIKVTNVNLCTMEMFEANSKEHLIANLDRVFRDEMRAHFRDELLVLWNGHIGWSGEGINYTLKGDPLDIRLYWRILPECLETWECVMVCIEDITALKQAMRAQVASEARFRDLFAHAPVSLWEEDYSQLKAYFGDLRSQGITDLQAYLSEHPETVDHCMSLIQVSKVNQKTLELFEAQNEEMLLSNLDKVFRDEMRAHFADELMDMWNGKQTYEREGINYSLSGEPINVLLEWTLMPGHEDDFKWVLVAIQDITARKKAEEYLRYLGTHDVMTGIYNRAYFEDQMLKLSSTKGSMSVMIADLNGLKHTNDNLGHLAGDNMIRRAAEVLRAAFGENEIVARIGGDEFVVLMPGVDAINAQEAMERVKGLIPLNNKFYQGPDLSMAIGISTRMANEPLEKLISRADDAMYADKSMQRKAR